MELITVAGAILIILQITLASLQLRLAQDELRKKRVKGTDENGQVSSAAKSAAPSPVETEPGESEKIRNAE